MTVLLLKNLYRQGNTMAGDIGFEPMRVGIKIRCLNQLGESPTKLYGSGYRIRTGVNAVKGHYPRPLDEPTI